MWWDAVRKLAVYLRALLLMALADPRLTTFVAGGVLVAIARSLDSGP